MTGQPLGAIVQPLPGCLVYQSTDVSYAASSQIPIRYDAEQFDVGALDSTGRMMGCHTTSAANLTGTVAKTSGSNVLTGTGTLFTTELSVGQAIFVPDAVAGGWVLGEYTVVIGITDDTHLTVRANFANTASGQTARYANEAIVFPQTGRYLITGLITWAANAGGRRSFELVKNGNYPANTDLASYDFAANSGTGIPTTIPFTTIYSATQFEFLLVSPFHSATGPLNIRGAVVNSNAYQTQLAIAYLGGLT
jgi:hypothetical protein